MTRPAEMISIVDPRALQRLRFVPGQDLLSRDFRDQAAFDAELRWWHNRAMHDAFGVRSGLDAHAVAGSEPLAIEVSPGLAYDAFGRELILPAPQRIAVPSGPQEQEPRVLVIRHVAASHQNGAEACGRPHPIAGCCGLPVPDVELAWITTRTLRAASGVPLGRITYDAGEPHHDPLFRPPVARAWTRPRIGRGSTVAGATEWQLWHVGTQGFVAGLQVRLDTRAAGFTRIPCYFAWIQGGIPWRPGRDGQELFLPMYAHLADATIDRFWFRVITVVSGLRGADGSSGLLSLARRRLTVCWLGIEAQGEAHGEAR